MQINTDRLVSLIAMVIGLGSLFIIVYQTALLREQQKASALPYLMLGLQANPERSYLFARNTGVGPALIEDVVVRYQGREIRTDLSEFFIERRPESAKTIPLGIDKLMSGRLVSSGEWINMLGTDSEHANALWKDFLGVFDIGEVPQGWYDTVGVPKSGPDKAIIEVTYRSVYGDRWRVTSDSVIPKPL